MSEDFYSTTKATSDQIAPASEAFDRVVPEQLAFDQILFEQMQAEPVVPESAVTKPLASEQIVPDPVVPEQDAPSDVPPNPVKPGKENNVAARPFRVKLRGSVLALVRLPNRRSVRAAIHQLSISGGVIHLEKPLDEKLEVELIFHIRAATIRGKAQMLFPMWATQGWMQPFRFVNLAAESRETLDEKLKSFLGETAKGAPAGL